MRTAVMRSYATGEDPHSSLMQQTFRAVMDAMARPGLLHSIAPTEPSTLGDPYLETLLTTLCDSACGFAVASRRREALVVDIALLTYAKPVLPSEADFAIVCADAPSPCEDFISELSGGSLLSPERSATVLFQCELLMETLIKSCHASWRPFSPLAALSNSSISPASPAVTRLARRENDSPSGATAFNQHFLMYEAMDVALRGFQLHGPGIARSHMFFSSSDEWYRARENRNDEFPCGIDFILFDRCGNVVCVPRTTEVEALDPCLSHIEDGVPRTAEVETLDASSLIWDRG